MTTPPEDTVGPRSSAPPEDGAAGAVEYAEDLLDRALEALEAWPDARGSRPELATDILALWAEHRRFRQDLFSVEDRTVLERLDRMVEDDADALIDHLTSVDLLEGWEQAVEDHAARIAEGTLEDPIEMTEEAIALVRAVDRVELAEAALRIMRPQRADERASARIDAVIEWLSDHGADLVAATVLSRAVLDASQRDDYPEAPFIAPAAAKFSIIAAAADAALREVSFEGQPLLSKEAVRTFLADAAIPWLAKAREILRGLTRETRARYIDRPPLPAFQPIAAIGAGALPRQGARVDFASDQGWTAFARFPAEGDASDQTIVTLHVLDCPQAIEAAFAQVVRPLEGDDRNALSAAYRLGDLRKTWGHASGPALALRLSDGDISLGKHLSHSSDPPR